MATIAWNIPDDQMNRFVMAFSNGYTDVVNGQPNPLTRAQFAKKQAWAMLMEQIRVHESRDIAEIPVT